MKYSPKEYYSSKEFKEIQKKDLKFIISVTIVLVIAIFAENLY